MNIPHVGIFWRIMPKDQPALLVCDMIPLSQAEPYGACLGYPLGHMERWESWRSLGGRALARLGLPSCIGHHEYEDFPRGRIVYRRTDQRFIAYADVRLQGKASRAAIVSRFALEAQRVMFALDSHYRRA